MVTDSLMPKNISIWLETFFFHNRVQFPLPKLFSRTWFDWPLLRKKIIMLMITDPRKMSNTCFIWLKNLSLQAQKMDKVELAGSLVAKCWSTFVDESEKILKMVKDNADFLASTTLDMLNNLYTEKRNNRKFYHEEHGRICQELQRLQDNVARLRGDYERCIDNYNSCKTKYDDQKLKGTKRIDEFKDRYLKVWMYKDFQSLKSLSSLF